MFDISSGVVQLLGIPQQFSGAASLSGESNLTSSAQVISVAAASLSAESNLTSAAVNIAPAAASLSAQSNLTSACIVVTTAACSVSGQSSLASSAVVVAPASASLSAQSNLTAATVNVINCDANLSGDSSLAADGTLVSLADATMSGESELTSFIAVVKQATVVPMSGDFSIAPFEALPIYRLIQQTYEQVYTDNILMSRYGIDTGKTILIKDNIVTVTDYVYQQEFEDADYAYQGGRWYQLSQEEYEAFVNAGRSDLVEVA